VYIIFSYRFSSLYSQAASLLTFQLPKAFQEKWAFHQHEFEIRFLTCGLT